MSVSGTNSAPGSGKLLFSNSASASSDEYQPSSRRSSVSEHFQQSSRVKFNTLAKCFSAATQKPRAQQQIGTVSEVSEDDMAFLQSELPVRKSSPTPSVRQDEIMISSALEDWKKHTKLSVTVTGAKGVGKSHLINTLLEASAPEEYDASRINSTSESSNNHINSQPGSDSWRITSPSSSQPSSEKLHRNNSENSLDSAQTNQTPYHPFSKALQQNFNNESENSDEMQVEMLRNDLRQVGVESGVKEYRRETGYVFEQNTVVPIQQSNAESHDDNLANIGKRKRAYKGFSLDEFLESTTKSAETVYSPAPSPYASIPATPNSEYSEVELDTRDIKRSTYKRATVYLFNGITSTDSGSQVSVTPIMPSRTFFPDEDWTNSIDWNEQRNQINDYTQAANHAERSPIQLNDRKSFLLPQGNPSNVPQLVAVRYGKVPELIVSFPQEGELRLALWELHEIRVLGTKQFESPEHQQVIETRYRKLLGLPDHENIPLSSIESPQDLPLDREVVQLLGQNFRFIGLGKSLEKDRIYVREKLQEITTNYAYHMCKFLVRVPSAILEGNKELIEISGSYLHNDFGTKMVLDSTNLLLVAVDRMRGLSSDIVHLLKDSNLAQKLASKPELHKAILIDLAEKHRLALPTDSLSSGSNLDVPPFESFKNVLLEQWRNALLLASSPSVSQTSTPENNTSQGLFNQNNSVSIQGAINEATLDQLVCSTTVLEAKPTLFRSVHLQNDFPADLLPESETPVRQILSETAIPSLLSTIPNRLLAKAAFSVKQLSQAVLMKNHHLLGASATPKHIEYPNPGNSAQQSAQRTNRLETLLSTFAINLQQWKQELQANIAQIDPFLVAQATQATINLLAALNNPNTSQNIDQIVPVIKQVAIKPMIDASQHIWRRSVANVPRKSEEIISSTQSLLSECASIIDLQFPASATASAQQSAIQSRLQEFVRNTNDNAIKQMVHFQDILNQDITPITKDSTIKALQQHVIADPMTGRLSHVSSLDALCPRMSQSIQSRLLALVTAALKHLDALQTEVIRALRAVTFAIKSHSTSSQTSAHTNPKEAITNSMLGEEPSDEMNSKLHAWNSATSNSANATQTDAEQMRHDPSTLSTLSRLASANVLNWPGSVYNRHQNFSDMNEVDYSMNQNESEAPVPMNPEEMSCDMASEPILDSVETKADFSILPQEESGVLLQHELWDEVLANTSSSRFYFETLLKNCKLTMGSQVDQDFFADANAQFKVLAHQVYGSPATHSVVRLLICSEILSNPDYYSNLLVHTRGNVRAQLTDIEEYVAIMSHEGCRGDNITLCAFSNFFGVDLLLFAPPFRQPLLLQSRRATSQAHLAVVAEHLKSVQTAGRILPQTGNKTLCLSILPEDEYAVLFPLKKHSLSEKSSNQYHHEADDEDSEFETKVSSKSSSGQQKRSRLAQLRRAFNRRKAMEVQIAPESSQMDQTPCDYSGAISGSTLYNYEDSDDSYDSLSDTDRSSEILRAINTNSSKKRKRSSSFKASNNSRDKEIQVFTRQERVNALVDLEQEPKMKKAKGETDAKPSAPVKNMSYHPILSQRSVKIPSLIDICLNGVLDGIESGSISSLAGKLPEEYLQRVLILLSERKKLSDTTVARVLDPTMTSIMLYGPCALISDVTMTNLAHECPMLRELVLMQCSNITSAGLMAVASRCPQLEHVTIKGCVGIGNVAIQEMARKCPRLEFIDISGCPLVTDVAVTELSIACPQLSTLIMQNCNQITDTAFMNYIGRNLQVLDMLESDQITNKTLASIARHCGPRLKISKQSGRGISDSGMETLLTSCTELRVLELTNADNITDLTLHCLWKNCPNLFSLNIAHCRNITNSAFTLMVNNNMEVEQDPANTDVNMQQDNLVLQLDSSFTLPRELTKINLATCMNIGDQAILSLAKYCPLLGHVNLSFCEEITDVGIVALAESCTNLKGLDLAKCNKITDKSLIALADNCVMLKRLILYNCTAIGDAGVVRLAQSCPTLREIDLCSTNVTDDALNALVESCRMIKSLAISDCKRITSTGIGHLSECSFLERLKLSGCKGVDDDALIKIGIGCPDMIDVDLAHCSAVTAVVLSEVISGWPKLSALNLRGYTPPTTDPSKRPEVRVNHPHLEDLNLSWCKFVDDEMVAEMSEGCPNLVTLDLGWCGNVTANAFHRVAQKCRNLRTLNLRGCTKVGALLVQHLHAAPIVVYR